MNHSYNKINRVLCLTKKLNQIDKYLETIKQKEGEFDAIRLKEYQLKRKEIMDRISELLSQ